MISNYISWTPQASEEELCAVRRSVTKCCYSRYFAFTFRVPISSSIWKNPIFCKLDVEYSTSSFLHSSYRAARSTRKSLYIQIPHCPTGSL